MLRQLLQFEIYYHTKQKLFYLFAAVFTFLGYSMLQNSGAINTFKNAPYWIHYYIGIATLMILFAVMVFVVNAMIRDRKHRIDSIIYSTSVPEFTFFMSRYFGTLMAGMVIGTFIVIGSIIGSFFIEATPDRLDDFKSISYIWTWLVFVLPNVFFSTTVLFAIATFTKRSLVTYVSAIALYGLYFLSAILSNSPLIATAEPMSSETLAIAGLIDPFGLSAFLEQTQYWTAYQKNNDLISLSGIFLWNRIIWLCTSTLILFVTYNSFSFRKK